MKLSVIIPCFNAADTLPIQLEALANQDYFDSWEVIISDNGSTDDSVAIVEQYKERLPNLRIVDSSKQQGRSFARNTAAKTATGDALAFCDADDEVAPGWVAAMGKALSKYEFVAGRLEYKKLNEAWVQKAYTLKQKNGLLEYKYPPYLPFAGSCNLGLKRSLHESVGGFDENMIRLQDVDYCWRLQLAGIKLHFVKDAVVHYRLRSTLNGMYEQARLWGEYDVFLYKKYQPLGMPQLSWKTSGKAWLHLLKRLPKEFFTKETRSKWVKDLAWRIGRVQGCVKYRILAF